MSEDEWVNIRPLSEAASAALEEWRKYCVGNRFEYATKEWVEFEVGAAKAAKATVNARDRLERAISDLRHK